MRRVRGTLSLSLFEALAHPKPTHPCASQMNGDLDPELRLTVRSEAIILGGGIVDSVQRQWYMY